MSASFDERNRASEASVGAIGPIVKGYQEGP